ncbi:hydroxymethylbilane synthase [Sphingobium subterraneum]|uniref:Porphobilinogen deaminase n=1 Tax=Sphingobium subterraneum TaxID=627688 RepID=A0A841J6F2_9SPHN|nr:hydroxymethylbilane synthase [Sphingobium subterraneum]MBB6124115.1 hydroxymethylbilane synthase [Sphingobium subterraneum]
MTDAPATHSPARPLRLGTRASPLAMVQAHLVADALRAAHGWDEDAILIRPVVASGDKVLDRPLADIGGKALWTKELDRSLALGEIDFAVHSMKDVETIRPDAFLIAAVLPRADVRDRLVGAESLGAIPAGGRLGTSSPRRAAQIRRLRPDVEIVLFRGNVATRLARLEAGEADATLLAAAGLDRLGQSDVGHAVPVDIMLPAPAQGTIGVEALANNMPVRALLDAIDHRDTHACVAAERAVLRALGGTCHSPIAALAVPEGDRVWLRTQILSNDGKESVATEARLDPGDEAAAMALGVDMLERASQGLRALFAP